MRNLPDPDPRETQTREVSFLTGCCLLFPAAALRDVGVFREDFFAYCEDVEWGLRAAKHGMRLVYAPAARLRHRVPAIRNAAVGVSNSIFGIGIGRRIVKLHYSGFFA